MREKVCGIYDWPIRHFWVIFTILSTVGAIATRIFGIGFKSGDYFTQLVWYEHFSNYGFKGFQTIYTDVGANYPPIFMLTYAFTSLLPRPSEIYTALYMKFPQMLMDFALAYIVFIVVRNHTQKKELGLLAFSAFLLSPLPFLNSSVWAQVDVLYACFGIAAAFCLFYEKYLSAFLLLGVSLGLKTMGVFILPVFILMAAHRKINPLYFALIPIPHIAASGLVSLLFNAPFKKTLLILFSQVGGGLARNSPNLAQFIAYPYILNSVGFVWLLALTLLACALLFYFFLQRSKPLTLSKFTLWCLVITLTVPSLLPNMHERFFYLPETFSLIYAFMKPKYFYIPLMIHVSSLSTYLGFLLGGASIFPLPYAALIMLGALCLLFVILRREEFAEG